MTQALIIVDVQNDFVTGTLPVPGGEGVAQRIVNHLLPHYEGYAVTTQDWHVDPGDHFTEWPEHCVAETWGAALRDELKGIHFDFAVKKGHHSAAYSGFEGRGHNGWDLRSWLLKKGVLHVDIVGLAFDHCVKATALDAIKEGFTARVLLDFTAAVDEDQIVPTIAELQKAGVRVEAGWVA